MHYTKANRKWMEFSKNLRLKQLKIKGTFFLSFFLFPQSSWPKENKTLSLDRRGLISNAKKAHMNKMFKIHYFQTKHLTLLEVSFLTCKMRGVNSSLVFIFYFQKYQIASGLGGNQASSKPHLNESRWSFN